MGVRNDRAWWVSQPFAIDGMLGRPSSEHDGAAWGVMVSARRGWSARMRLKQMCSRGIHVGSSARAHLKRHGHGDGRARQLGRGAQHRAGRGEGRRRRHEGEEQLQNGHQAVWASGWRARGLGRMGVRRRDAHVRERKHRKDSHEKNETRKPTDTVRQTDSTSRR